MTGQELCDRFQVKYHYGLSVIRERRINANGRHYHFRIVRCHFTALDGRHFTALNVACFDGNTYQVYKNTSWYNVRYLD